MKIGWEEALEAMYGTQVSDKQIPVWEHYLKAEKTNSDELVKAIELAAEEGIKAEEWRVTVRDLRIWLRLYRKRKLAQNDADRRRLEIVGFVRYWTEKISRGGSKDDFLCALDELGLNVIEHNDVCGKVLK